jgi:hypothetical protein
MPPVELAALLPLLRAHRDETEAGRWLLERVLEGVEALLRETRFASTATASGASLHLHDGAGFRLSLGVERRDGVVSADHHASANIWAGLNDHAEALTLDVRAPTLRGRSGRVQPLDGPRQQSGTLVRLGKISVTHLLGLPLRAPGRGLLGMITVEIACRSAMGLDLGLFGGAGRGLGRAAAPRGPRRLWPRALAPGARPRRSPGRERRLPQHSAPRRAGRVVLRPRQPRRPPRQRPRLARGLDSRALPGPGLTGSPTSTATASPPPSWSSPCAPRARP